MRPLSHRLRLIQCCFPGSRVLWPLILVAVSCGLAALPSTGDANQPPVLAPIGNSTVNEGLPLTFTATATDADGDALTFSMDAGAAPGAMMTTGGVFTWTPTGCQGPGSYPITVRVTDNGDPAMDDFELITITVREVNVAPLLAPIGNKNTTCGVLLSFTATAADADCPANMLIFTLGAGAPAGATITALTGVFTWTPSSNQTGSFTVTVQVTDNGVPPLSALQTITVTVNCGLLPATIHGRVFYDANGNATGTCVPDLLEIGLPSWSINVMPGFAGLTDSNGDYKVGVPAGTYTVEVTPKAAWTQTCPTSPSYHTVTVVAGQVLTGINFGQQALAPIQDLSVSVGGSPARPGFNKFYSVGFINDGTLQVSATSVTLTLPPQVTFVSSGSGGVYDSGTHSVTWSLGVVALGQIGNLIAYVNIPAATPLGTLLTSSVAIDPVSGDASPVNNSDTETQTVVGSYDPNDKLVAPQGRILRTDPLNYHINFQNVGTADAINVVVRDQLDTDLDLSSVQLGAATAPYAFTVNGRELAWTFSNINLPPSSMNEPGSHGFVTFRVRPKADVADCTLIENSAAIFFDFNEPVITNQVTSEVFCPPTAFPARVFTATPQSRLKLGSGKALYCLQVEPVGGSFSVTDVDPASMMMKFGSAHISLNASKTIVVRDSDGNQIPELTACFGKGNLITLFASLPAGKTMVTVAVEGQLIGGGQFSGEFTFEVSKPADAAAASVSPNPLNPEGTLTFFMSKPGLVRVKLYDLNGRLIRTLMEDSDAAAGYHDVRIDGRGRGGEELASGVYFYRVEMNREVVTGRFAIMK